MPFLEDTQGPWVGLWIGANCSGLTSKQIKHPDITAPSEHVRMNGGDCERQNVKDVRSVHH